MWLAIHMIVKAANLRFWIVYLAEVGDVLTFPSLLVDALTRVYVAYLAIFCNEYISSTSRVSFCAELPRNRCIVINVALQSQNSATQALACVLVRTKKL